MAKRLFADAGIRCPEGVVADRATALAGDVIARPYVVKPNNEGSSVGVRIVRVGDNAKPFDEATWPYGEQVLIEPYVPGRELTVGDVLRRKHDEGEFPPLLTVETHAKVRDAVTLLL